MKGCGVVLMRSRLKAIKNAARRAVSLGTSMAAGTTNDSVETRGGEETFMIVGSSMLLYPCNCYSTQY